MERRKRPGRPSTRPLSFVSRIFLTKYPRPSSSLRAPLNPPPLRLNRLNLKMSFFVSDGSASLCASAQFPGFTLQRGSSPKSRTMRGSLRPTLSNFGVGMNLSPFKPCSVLPYSLISQNCNDERPRGCYGQSVTHSSKLRFSQYLSQR